MRIGQQISGAYRGFKRYKMLSYNQRTLTIGGGITVEWSPVLKATASKHTKNNIISMLVKSSLVKLETSCKVILPAMVSVLWIQLT